MNTHTSSRAIEANRLGLVVAVVLTVVAIATGTWMLGSGSDPADPATTPVIAEQGGPQRNLAPLAVAPPPDATSDRASRKAKRTSQH